jgi:hypothetical protein
VQAFTVCTTCIQAIEPTHEQEKLILQQKEIWKERGDIGAKKRHA